ncbi:MAG: hypothetical protein JSS07_08500 [Proteobacteria bacterium]|nr:hypothetical protein [Pseudomonadota bacterium]
MAKKGPTPNIQNGSPLQRMNIMLEHELKHFDDGLLATPGLLRMQGREADVNLLYQEFLKDPIGFKIPKDKNLDTHVKLGLVKKAASEETMSFSPAALMILTDFVKDLRAAKESAPTFEILMNALVQNGAFEEAKMIHNILHFGYKIAQAHKKRLASGDGEQLMLEDNVAMVLSPWIANRTDPTDPTEYMGNRSAIQDSLMLTLQKDPNIFAKSFQETYPQYDQKLNNQYQAQIKPQIEFDQQLNNQTDLLENKPKEKGNLLTRFFLAIVSGFRGLFAKEEKKHKQEVDNLIKSNKNPQEVITPEPYVLNDKNKTYLPTNKKHREQAKDSTLGEVKVENKADKANKTRTKLKGPR